MYARPRHRFRGADCDSAVSLDDPTYLAEKVFFFFFFFFFQTARVSRYRSALAEVRQPEARAQRVPRRRG
jgi:hypothetical protein